MDRTPAFTRRHVLRFLGGTALSAVLAGGLAAPADAGRSWCRADPVVKIDGKVADIWLSGDAELNETATGPTQIEVYVPTGVSTELLAMDLGFNQQGYAVSFHEDASLEWGAGGPEILIRVLVPASTSGLSFQVNFAPRSLDLPSGTASGVVNEWVTLGIS